MNTTPNIPLTLEEIAGRKEETLRQLRERKQRLGVLSKEVFSPVEPGVSGRSSLMQTINTGMAIFDGVMLGLKVMRRVRRLFSGR